MFEIYAAVNHFEQDDSAHAMILTGARDPNSNGPTKEAYSSGGYFNPDAYDGVSDKIMQQLEQTDIAQKRTTLKIYQCDKPVVAAINGPAIGGAYTLTLAAADQIYPGYHGAYRAQAAGIQRRLIEAAYLNTAAHFSNLIRAGRQGELGTIPAQGCMCSYQP